MEKSVFETLATIDCKEHTETKNGLTYLSWAWAWAYVKKLYPDANYRVIKFDGLPYVYDPQSGIIVYTEVTIQDTTHEMWLPVMDGTNKALLFVEQKYQAWNRYEKRYEEKSIPAATMFDINKTIMRCLTKNLAMFGLGINIYAGEDLPVILEEESQGIQEKPQEVAKPAENPGKPASTSKAGKKKTQGMAPNAAETAQSARYTPMTDEDTSRVLYAAVKGQKSRKGLTMREEWQKATNAGEQELAWFDSQVRLIQERLIVAEEGK